MVDMTDFHQWTQQVEDLAAAIETMIVDYLQSTPNTKAESVIPASLLASYRLHTRVCRKLGIAEDKANANFAHQAKMTQSVHLESQTTAEMKSDEKIQTVQHQSFYQANDPANAAGAGEGGLS